ncbi:ribonuclease H-like domain-containing protein [Tanacetum coccineum]
MVPRAVLMKSGLVSINTARQNISKKAVLVNTVIQVNAAHSKTTVNTARLMSYLSKTTHSTGNPQMDLQDKGVIDSGCSRHMTGNMSYLTDYEEIDEGYVAFGGNPKGGKITGKCTIKTENLVDHKVKVIRCDNGTEFKNREMNQFCEMKGILRQFSVARTPQQNGVAERRNRTLIEVARTMLADSKLSTTFWVEAVNTACYVQNRVLVVKPHNKTPYELFHGITPTLSFMRPFKCPVTILNNHRSLRQI